MYPHIVLFIFYRHKKFLNMQMITITESAREKIVEILNEENNPNLNLRTFIEGGGCSGFQYGFALVEDQDDSDWSFDLNDDYKVLVDFVSMQYLEGCKIDYTEGAMGSQFVIDNPNAETTCGCGSSFGV